MPVQNLVGRKARVSGINNLEPTEENFGLDDVMNDYIGQIGKIEHVFKDVDYYQDEHGNDVRGTEFISGVSMFDFQWDIEDIELITPEPKSNKLKKVVFDPKHLFEGNKNADQHKRTGDGTKPKRRAKVRLKTKRNTNKAITRLSPKRNIKVRR